MTDFFKAPDTVAVDTVCEFLERTITIYRDLAELAIGDDTASRLRRIADHREQQLAAMHETRRLLGDIPAIADPERAHLAALWIRLKAAVRARGDAPLDQALGDLDAQLHAHVEHALSFPLPAEIRTALENILSSRSGCPS